MFLALRPGVPAILNDANPELVMLYEVVRDTPDALMRALDRHAARYSEKYFFSLRASSPRSPVGKAARLIFLNKTCFNGLYRLNSRGKFNVPFGHRTSSFKSYTASGFSEADQTRLRDACVRAAKRGASVFVSNSSAPIIFDLYEDWEIHRLPARRAINSKAHLRGSVDETLIVLHPSRRRSRPTARKKRK